MVLFPHKALSVDTTALYLRLVIYPADSRFHNLILPARSTVAI